MRLDIKYLPESRACLPNPVGSVYSGSFLYPHNLAVILTFEILTNFL
jgi:hypothetical protein